MTDRERLPWFPFYPSDWMESEDVMSMSYSERGIYLQLLCIHWRKGSIRQATGDLALALGLGTVEQADSLGLSRVLATCFVPHPSLPGRLINPRLAELRAKQALIHDKQARGGRQAALRRLRAKHQVKSTDSDADSNADRKTTLLRNEGEPSAPEKLQLPEQPLPEEPVGAWYGRALKSVLWPTGSSRDQESRDISVLKRQLRKVDRGDVELAVREVRAQADGHELKGWIERGQGFGLMALVMPANGGIDSFERFRHAAIKRKEGRE